MHENEVVFQQKPYRSGNGPAIQFWQMENASRMSHILDSRAVSLVFVWTRRSLPWFCPKEEALWSQWWSNECFHNRYFKQVIGKFRFFFFRRLFSIMSYFFFFYNILLGIFSCTLRIVFGSVLGVLFLSRIDRTTLMPGYQAFDRGK